MSEQAPTPTAAIESSDLTPAQHRALVVLLKGGTQEQAGQAAGVTARTVRNWLTDEAFAATLTLERRALWEQTLCQVQQAAAQATQTLVEALADIKATVRMRAAKLILDLQLKLQRLQASHAAKAGQRTAPRNQTAQLRNDAEAIVAHATHLQVASPASRALRLVMPQ